LAYALTGHGSETLLCLHPAFGNRACFQAQVEGLQEQFRLLTVDLPGHGDSVGRLGHHGRPATVAETPDLLMDILDQESIPMVHLLGVSLGSLLAQDVARKHPERAKSLTSVGGYALEDQTVARAQRQEMLKWIPMVLFSMRRFREYVAEASVAEPVQRERFLEMAEGTTRRTFFALRDLGSVLNPDRPDAVQCPLLILVGEKDLEVSIEASRRWHRAREGSRFAVISDAGHCVNMDRPDTFNSILATFLTDLADQRSRN
jgi:pimeloyl-ACP methyl ester carboxylesterase